MHFYAPTLAERVPKGGTAPPGMVQGLIVMVWPAGGEPAVAGLGEGIAVVVKNGAGSGVGDAVGAVVVGDGGAVLPLPPLPYSLPPLLPDG